MAMKDIRMGVIRGEQRESDQETAFIDDSEASPGRGDWIGGLQSSMPQGTEAIMSHERSFHGVV